MIRDRTTDVAAEWIAICDNAVEKCAKLYKIDTELSGVLRARCGLRRFDSENWIAPLNNENTINDVEIHNLVL